MPETETVEEQVVGSEVVETDAGEQTATESSARQEKPAFDRTKLESNVANRLAAAFGDETPADEAAETSTEETPAEEQTTTDEEEVVETEKVTEDEGAAAKPEQTGTQAPTLPAAYIRTLKAYEWTDEEIAQNLKVLGSKFVETAAKLHNNRNAEVSKWADAGRQAKAAQQQQQTQQTQTIPTTLTPLKPFDITALKEHYGDDKFITEFEKMNTMVAQVNAILPAVQEVQQRSQTAELETLVRQIDGFFGGKELEPFKGVYGDATSIASNKTQQEARNKVLEMADALRVGAEIQGRPLSLGEALTLAHDSLSSGYKVQAVRTTIQKQLKTRNKGITQAPRNRAANPDGKNGTRTGLERRVAAGLAKAFG